MYSRCYYSILQMAKQSTDSSTKFLELIELVGRRAVFPSLIIFYLMENVVSPIIVSVK